jgi:hypothetical protein
VTRKWRSRDPVGLADWCCEPWLTRFAFWRRRAVCGGRPSPAVRKAGVVLQPRPRYPCSRLARAAAGYGCRVGGLNARATRAGGNDAEPHRSRSGRLRPPGGAGEELRSGVRLETETGATERSRSAPERQSWCRLHRPTWLTAQSPLGSTWWHCPTAVTLLQPTQGVEVHTFVTTAGVGAALGQIVKCFGGGPAPQRGRCGHGSCWPRWRE